MQSQYFVSSISFHQLLSLRRVNSYVHAFACVTLAQLEHGISMHMLDSIHFRSFLFKKVIFLKRQHLLLCYSQYFNFNFSYFIITSEHHLISTFCYICGFKIFRTVSEIQRCNILINLKSHF